MAELETAKLLCARCVPCGCLKRRFSRFSGDVKTASSASVAVHQSFLQGESHLSMGNKEFQLDGKSAKLANSTQDYVERIFRSFSIRVNITLACSTADVPQLWEMQKLSCNIERFEFSN